MFSEFEEALNSTQISQKEAKAVRSRVLETYPQSEEFIDTLWPKKESVL